MSLGSWYYKIINACKVHKIAPPVFSNIPPDFQVLLIKHTDKKGFKEFSLKEELIKIILHIQNGSISNSVVQTICMVSKATASRYLRELEIE